LNWCRGIQRIQPALNQSPHYNPQGRPRKPTLKNTVWAKERKENVNYFIKTPINLVARIINFFGGDEESTCALGGFNFRQLIFSYLEPSLTMVGVFALN